MLLTIVTRYTEKDSDDEYETVWLTIANRHAPSKYVAQLGPAMCFTLANGYLLIVSGTNAATEQSTPQEVTQTVIQRVEQAVNGFDLVAHEHVILYHSSYRYDKHLLADGLNRLGQHHIGYNFGERYELPIYGQLYIPLVTAVEQYLINEAQTILLQERYKAAVDYARTGEQRQLPWPTIDFRLLFTEAEREQHIFICNPDNFGLDDIDDNLLTSPEALERFLRAGNAQTVTKKVIVLCELNWVWEGLDNKQNPFRGVEIVKQLRLRALLATPVLFVSAAPQNTVYRFDDAILFAVGHHFVSLHELHDPTLKKVEIFEALRHSRLSLPTLSTLELLDIREHFCDTTGTKKLLLHQLKNFERRLPSNEGGPNSKRLRSLAHTWTQQFADVCGQIGITSLDLTATATNLIVLVRESISKLENQIGTSTQKPSAAETNWYQRRSWNVVIVDDEATDERYQLLKDKLATYQCTVKFYRTADEVYTHLNDEIKNRDTRVLIADYRLAESGGFPPKLQYQQGYDILAHVATRKDLAIALVAFSGMPRKFLMHTFNQFGIKVDVFSKLDYFKNEQSIGEFADKIIQLGDDCEGSLYFMPRTTHWKDTLEPSYRAYRKALNRDEIEEAIAVDATKLIDNYRSGEKLDVPFCDYATTTLSKDLELTEETIKPFVRVFAARRFAAYVGLNEKRSGIQKPSIQNIISFILKKQKTDAGVFATTKLAFNLSALPFGLTYEEIRFLKYQYDIDVRRFMYVAPPLLNELTSELRKKLEDASTSLVARKKSKKGRQ